MARVSLAEAKSHLRILHSFEDEAIGLYIDAAEGHVEAQGVVYPDGPLPPSLKAAILLMASHLFTNRDAVTDSRVNVLPMGFDALCAPFRPIIF